MKPGILVIAMWSLVGCDAGTGGQLTTVSFALEVANRPVITLDDGATVELSRASLSFGPVYVYESPPPAMSWWRRASDLVMSTAHAHAGHDFFAGGRVMTEWIQPRVLDLTTSRHELGRVSAIAGAARSMSIHLLRDEDNDGRALRLAGTVSRAGVARPFQLEVALPGGFDDQRVDFVPVDLELNEGAEVLVVVDPAVWFRGARFEEDSLEPVVPDSQTGRAVQINVRRFAAWTGLVQRPRGEPAR
jgi:hypothetical protein